jgi:hypothetical protein
VVVPGLWCFLSCCMCQLCKIHCSQLRQRCLDAYPCTFVQESSLTGWMVSSLRMMAGCVSLARCTVGGTSFMSTPVRQQPRQPHHPLCSSSHEFGSATDGWGVEHDSIRSMFIMTCFQVRCGRWAVACVATALVLCCMSCHRP